MAKLPKVGQKLEVDSTCCYNRGLRFLLTMKDRIIGKDESLQWVFLKVIAKTTNKRSISDYIQQAWNIRSWVTIQRLSSSTFKFGFLNMEEFKRLIQAKWDWYEDTIITM